MPTTDLPAAPPTPPRQQAPAARPISRFGPAQRDQFICIAIAVILLGLIFLLQPVLNQQRKALVQSDDRSMGNLAINFPRLTLGGFRGILAAVMWERAESAKNHRDWIPLETDYNIISKLEPYFASAYVFNGWNQSYNLSAQFHAEDQKYKWVLDGLVYLYKGERFNHNNVNLICEEANDFFLKLGASFERSYYTAHWRFDIAHEYLYKPHAPNVLHDNTLAEVRYILNRPQFHVTWLRGPHRTPGHGVELPIPWKHGKKKVSFPYGVSPYYFAYVEYQRAKKTHQRPESLGVVVLDAWPGMSLRLWCKDDLDYSQRVMRRMFIRTKPLPSQVFTYDVLDLRDCFRNIQFNAPEAMRLLAIHDLKYPYDAPVQEKHIVQSSFFKKLGQAESDLFNGLVQWQLAHRRFRLGDPADRYLAAAVPLYKQANARFQAFLEAAYPHQPNNPDRLADEKYARGIQARIDGIDNFRQTARRHAPDLSFLNAWTCEH